MLSEEKSEKERRKYQAGTRAENGTHAENESAKHFWSVRARADQRGGQPFESPDMTDVAEGVGFEPTRPF